jgi:multicomponent Na+:H+ antiporter subunit D
MEPWMPFQYIPLIPLLGVIAILVGSRVSDNVRETATLITAVLTATAVWGLAPAVMDGQRFSLTLIDEVVPGIPLTLQLEPLGAMFAILAGSLWVVNSIYSIGYMRGNKEKHQTRFYVFFAVSISAALAVAFAGNAFTLFLFYECLTLSTYPLVSHKGDEKTIKSARIYLGVLISTSICLFLPAVIWAHSVSSGEFTPGGVLSDVLAGPAVGLMLGLFLFGIGKAAVMPVHRWLPAAMVAPTPVSALLHAVAVVKAGVFSITKVVIYLFGVDFLFSQATVGWMLYAAAATIILSSLVALQQTNLKRMLAYSTIGQLSYVVLAVGVLTPLAEVGATLHMVAHAFGKITLFFAAGAIYVASKKTELPQLAGIGRRMPWTAAAFTIGAISMIGVPPTGGFVSKWYILAGAFQSDNYAAIATLIVSTGLTAMYFLPVVYSMWFGREVEGPIPDHGEAPLPMRIALLTTAALTILFFFFNGPVKAMEAQVLLGAM